MDHILIYSGLLVAAAGYLIEVRPRLYNRYFGVDVWRNLSIVDFIRTHGRLPEHLPTYMLKGPFDYPPFLLFLLSFLPKMWLEKNQGFISPVFDFLHSFLVFFVTYYLTDDYLPALIAQLLYISAPMTIMENAQLTPRSLGVLFFSCCMMAAFMGVEGNSWFFLALSVAFGGACLLTSKMATQTLFLTFTAFTVIEMNPLFVAVLVASLVGTVIATKGFYLQILKGQLCVFKYFRIIINDRYSHQVRGAVASSKNSDLIGRINHFIGRFPVFAFVLGGPVVTLAFAAFLSQGLTGTGPFTAENSTILHRLGIWLGIIWVMGVATAQVKPIQFLGEGTKYIAYGMFPAAIVLASYGAHMFYAVNNIVPLMIIAALILASLVQAYYLQNRIIVNDTSRTITPALRRVMDFLQGIKDEVRLATIPFSLADGVAYFVGCQILSSDSGHVLGNSEDYLDFYPVLRRPLPEILKKHNINYLLINKNYVTLEELRLGNPEAVLQEENFILIKVL